MTASPSDDQPNLPLRIAAIEEPEMAPHSLQRDATDRKNTRQSGFDSVLGGNQKFSHNVFTQLCREVDGPLFL